MSSKLNKLPAGTLVWTYTGEIFEVVLGWKNRKYKGWRGLCVAVKNHYGKVRWLPIKLIKWTNRWQIS